MINQYIIDNNGTVYIGIKNVDNRFCYYISAIQRLHSSPTLTNALQKFQKDIQDSKYRIILKPLEIYSRIKIDKKYNINNIQEIYNQLETELITTTNNLSEKLQHGGNPDHVLITLFLPTIYNVFGLDVLKSVIHELYINPNRLNFLLYDNSRIHDFELTKDNSLNNELYKGFCELQKALKNEPLKIKNNEQFDFIISTMSIMFKDMYGQQSNYNGHALNIIKGVNDEGKEDLYIIDDSVGISPFQIFLDRHRDRIGYWEIKDATDKLLQQIGGFNGISIDKRLHRDVLNVVNENNQNNLNGGNSEENEKLNKYTEEIVNDCSWCPFVSVKDNWEKPGNKQEIYGIVGGRINSDSENSVNTENTNTINISNTTNTNSTNTENILNTENSANITKNTENSANITKNTNSENSETNNIPLKIKIYNQFQSPLNKYLSMAIIVLIVIIIILLIVRYKKVKRNRKRIETYVNKIKDTRKKNIELATQLIKKRQEIEQPKKEVAAILQANNKKPNFEMPITRNKTDFFHPKIPLYQSPISRYSNINFNFKK